MTGYAKYAVGVLVFTLGVILWGAFVRHTGSGAGCGSHWPTCNGEVIPRPEAMTTIIEFTHRVTSGLVLLLTLGLAIWGHRAFAQGHPVRAASKASLLFVIISAVIGMLFVRMGWVEGDDSVGRAIALPIHLANTLLLLGAMVLTVWYAAGGAKIKVGGQGFVSVALLAALAATMFVGISGAVTSLGDTLFPVANSSQVVQDAMSPTSHFLVRLRVFHPLIAMTSGVIIILAVMLAATVRPSRASRFFAVTTVSILVVQMMSGLLAVALKAPTWMALTHLAIGDMLWMGLVLFTASALGMGAERASLAAQPAGGTALGPVSVER